MDYEKLYPDEQNSLMFILRIFGECAQNAKFAALNQHNKLPQLCIELMVQDDKFSKEVRLWALIIINRSVSHADLMQSLMEICVNFDQPTFIDFVLGVTVSEDKIFISHTAHIWEGMARLVEQRNGTLVSQLQGNRSLSDKLHASEKRRTGIDSIDENIKKIIALMEHKEEKQAVNPTPTGQNH